MGKLSLCAAMLAGTAVVGAAALLAGAVAAGGAAAWCCCMLMRRKPKRLWFGSHRIIARGRLAFWASAGPSLSAR